MYYVFGHITKMIKTFSLLIYVTPNRFRVIGQKKKFFPVPKHICVKIWLVRKLNMVNWFDLNFLFFFSLLYYAEYVSNLRICVVFLITAHSFIIIILAEACIIMIIIILRTLAIHEKKKKPSFYIRHYNFRTSVVYQ